MHLQCFARSVSDLTQEPYLDEMAHFTVTSPTGVVLSMNVVRWATACTDPMASTININGGGQAVDITSLFGSEVGTFTIVSEVRNQGPPAAWSDGFIVR